LDIRKTISQVTRGRLQKFRKTGTTLHRWLNTKANEPALGYRGITL
jgi:hypothetical protein